MSSHNNNVVPLEYDFGKHKINVDGESIQVFPRDGSGTHVRELIRDCCVRQRCDEQWDFIIAVYNLSCKTNLSQVQLKAELSSIADTYITEGTQNKPNPKEANILSQTRTDLLSKVQRNELSPADFTIALREVFTMFSLQKLLSDHVQTLTTARKKDFEEENSANNKAQLCLDLYANVDKLKTIQIEKNNNSSHSNRFFKLQDVYKDLCIVSAVTKQQLMSLELKSRNMTFAEFKGEYDKIVTSHLDTLHELKDAAQGAKGISEIVSAQIRYFLQPTNKPHSAEEILKAKQKIKTTGSLFSSTTPAPTPEHSQQHKYSQ